MMRQTEKTLIAIHALARIFAETNMAHSSISLEVLTFRALADPTRLRLVNLLQYGEQCVCQLVEALELPQPKVSRHLAALKKAGLVTSRKKSNWMYYSLKEAGNEFHERLLVTLERCFQSNVKFSQDCQRLTSMRCFSNEP
jgi:ArsR family transcriptional regulator, arsenate/arsenite/antimonite-responsive transcriptional repressor